MTGADGSSRAALAEDARARELAQTVFDRPLVLEAGAGTGKTTVLVARAVVWCLGPGWERARQELAPESAPSGSEPRRIATRVLRGVVAITFTEAAAAEMEERIARALDALAAGRAPPEGVLEAALPALPNERAARARALLEVLDHLFVQTIHGYCRRLLAAYPLEAGLHPRFEVDARGLRRGEVVRAALEERLRAALRDPGDPDLLYLARRGLGPVRVEQALADLVEAAVCPAEFAPNPLDPERLRAFARRLIEAIDGLRAAEGGRLGGLPTRAKAHAVVAALDGTRRSLAEAPPEDPEALEAFARGLQPLWPKDNLQRLADWGRGEFKKQEAAALGEARDALAARATALRPLLEHAVALDPPLLAAAHRVLHGLLERAEAALGALGAESYQALLRDAHRLLVGHPAACARERRCIDQLLVDEFQDTDRLQYEIVAKLALGGAPAERPGLFLVGDPKQSIYGWRNADLRAYAAFRRRIHAAGGTLHGLCRNYRSVSAILDEVERVVAPVMVEREGIQPRFQPLLRGDEEGPPSDSEPAVQYWLSTRLDPETLAPARTTSAEATQLEAEALAHELVRARREEGLAWREVGILLRSTGDLELYLDALRRAAVPYVVDRDRTYHRRREVLEAGALVRAVLDPNDQIALIAVCRSAWVGVPDAAWLPLWAHGFPDTARDGLLGDATARQRAATLAADVAASLDPSAIPGLERVAGWERNLAHALDVLAELRRTFETEPADRFVERLRVLPLLEATEAARHPGAHRLANLERFFRELLLTLEASEGSAAALLRTLRRGAGDEREADEGLPRDALEDAVQVMTIHKAKGLDFGRVYLMQVHKGRGVGQAPEAVVDELDGRLEYRLFGAPTPGWDVLESQRREVERAELVRTLYVAMTRARTRLVLAGCWGEASRGVPGSHADLLAVGRGASARAALEHVGNGHARESRARFELEGVGWLLPALGADTAPASPAARPPLPPRARVAEESAQLARARDAARAHAERPFAGAASARDQAQLSEPLDDSDAAGAPLRAAAREAVPAAIARAVGTAIHALLERVDWDADPAAELARQRSFLEATLTRLVSGEGQAQASARAGSLLRALVRGPLWGRLRELAPHVLARELPVLLPPRDAGAVGYVAGAIDLVYREPGTDELVVADFKTDRVSGPAADRRLLETYASQGEVYTRALREALGLPSTPRFELWLLEAGRVVAAGG